MKAQQLKNAILQLAIQGKLVPQDPNDEPASVLFEKIQAEKEKLIAEGKIKKTKKTSDKRPLDVEADFPFEIPDSWKWVTLENILYQLTDGTHATPRYTSSGVPFISVKDISNGKLSFENTKYISLEEHFELSKRCKPEKGDILLSKVGTTGIPVAVNTNIEFSIFVSIALLKLFPTLIFSDFLIYAIQSPLVQLQAKANTRGVGNKNWVLSSIGRTIIPLPPLNEQKRIVAKIEELLPFIEEYDKKEQKLTTLNQQFPDQLKKSILQAAIQGQLVAQDPNDELASELIKRIQAEKERLISEKKIKKPKVKSEIVVRDGLPYEIINGVERCIADELPFEIPESWCWVRLGDIGDWGAGSTPNRHEPKFYDNGTIPWLKTGDLNDGYITSIPEYITNFALEKNSLKINPTGSVLIAMYGATIGKLGILGIEATTNQACCACQVYKGVYNKYLFYYLMSQKKELQKRSEGSGQPNISREKIIKYLFPLPPIDEQKRIVQKIEEVFSHIQSL
jgi:type I restriction-modification system, S subunit